ncbi:hypothetical protein B0T16DRAFT_431673 [Cercophora newfieldiana]|uniref:N-acetylgalactosaminide beta-1,3-galactosyltransferase n=1 Tax=Cercophora newfieldiana TaxID=92897 RepID=A0AA39XXS0_9PEZI|nr:hypothetical protein B0T16DRAFT_431673 [Cercophora newfieldiana]
MQVVRLPKRIVRLIITSFVSSCLFLVFLDDKNLTTFPLLTSSSFRPVSYSNTNDGSTQDLCKSFPRHLLQSIQPVLKMGWTESQKQIHAQLETVSACFDPNDLLIVSDYEETILGRVTIDIFETLPEEYRRRSRDFARHNAMKRKPLNMDDGRAETTHHKLGWKMDKYKFLAQVEYAWSTMPGRDWYVFYETDTYVLWDSMFRFLSTLDAAEALYIGSPSPGRRGTWFANGGPGFVLSRGAMQKVLGKDQGWLTSRGAKATRRDCCGDSVLGWMLWQARVPLSGFYPLFSLYAVDRVPFTERAWCQPVITMHKLTPGDMLRLWRWEHGNRKRDTPILFSDLYEFTGINETDVRYDWDNTSYDRLAPGRELAAETHESCRAACEADGKCLQYLWRGLQEKHCVLMPFVSLGKAGGQDAGSGMYVSGWMHSRIEDWRAGNVCEDAAWVHPSIARHF